MHLGQVVEAAGLHHTPQLSHTCLFITVTQHGATELHNLQSDLQCTPAMWRATCLGKGRVSVRPLWLMVMKPSSMSMLGVPYSPIVPSFTRWHSGASSCIPSTGQIKTQQHGKVMTDPMRQILVSRYTKVMTCHGKVSTDYLQVCFSSAWHGPARVLGIPPIAGESGGMQYSE